MPMGFKRVFPVILVLLVVQPHQPLHRHPAHPPPPCCYLPHGPSCSSSFDYQHQTGQHSQALQFWSGYAAHFVTDHVLKSACADGGPWPLSVHFLWGCSPLQGNFFGACVCNVTFCGIQIFLLLRSPCKISEPYDNPFSEAL